MYSDQLHSNNNGITEAFAMKQHADRIKNFVLDVRHIFL